MSAGKDLISRTKATHGGAPAFEVLEPRLLLSIDGAGGYWFGPALISPEWFESSTMSSPSPAASAVREVTGTSDADHHGEEEIPGRLQWIVQLSESALKNVASVSEAAALFADAPGGLEVVRGLGMKGQLLLRSADDDPASVVEWLGRERAVAHFERDLVLTAAVIPDDARFSSLWGLHNTGQSGGVVDADIDAPEAWDITTGRADIVVAVIDTGVDYTHPDLAANIWTNPGEIPANGIDDDGNGFIDDVHGYDFVNDDGDPMDDHSHGTHCAGTIAAVGDNGTGVAGVGWSTSVMALKFLSSSGSGYTSDAVRAVNYATMMKTRYGVDVVLTSNSWGGGGYSTSLRDAIAASGDAGMLFIAAAGNSSNDNDATPSYPASYDLDNVIAVAATDSSDQLASFSSYGATSVDLTAPGVSILSTVPGGSYSSYSGTSMATPHVSGVAALAWSMAPEAGYERIRAALLDGVDPVASLDGIVATGGRLNAYGTLAALTMQVAGTDPAPDSVVASPHTEFEIRFSDAIDPASVRADGLEVNGVAADDARIAGADTVVFVFDTSPVVQQGAQTVNLSAGAVRRAADGEPVEAWTARFYYDAFPLSISATTPAPGATLAADPTHIVVRFNEDIAPDSVVPGGLTLDCGTVTSALQTASDTVQYAVRGLTDDGPVTFTLASGAVTDRFGNPSPEYTGRFVLDDPTHVRYESADVPLNIADLTTISSSLVIADSFAIADLDVELDITHTYDGDLEAYLVAPDGTRVCLFDSVGLYGNNFTGTVLDDEAETPISSGSAPFTGRYRPDSPLSVLDGTDAAGTWQLEITDHYAWDEGTLDRWGLVFRQQHDTGPRIVDHSAFGDITGTVDTVRVTFNEPIAAGTFTPGDVVRLDGPAGAFLPAGVAAVPGTGGTQFDVTFAPQTRAGDYTLVIGPGIAGLDGQTMDQDRDLVTGEWGTDATRAEGGDDQYAARFYLGVEQHFVLSGPAAVSLLPGQTVSVEWTAENVLPGSTVSLCYDEDTVWWNGNEHWIVVDAPVTEGPGSYAWDTTGVAPGMYYVAGYMYDWRTTVTVSQLTESVRVMQPFTLTGPAGTVFAGDPITVEWTAEYVTPDSIVSLCYDEDAVWWNGNEHWIVVDHPLTAGAGTYTWNTAGVAPGTYYLAGYTYDWNGTVEVSHPGRAFILDSRFRLTGPENLSVSAGETVPIEWTATDWAPGTTISLCYDEDTTYWNGNEHWIVIDRPVSGGDGAYAWNTAGVRPGTYYVAGYMYDWDRTLVISQLYEPVTIPEEGGTAAGMLWTAAPAEPSRGVPPVARAFHPAAAPRRPAMRLAAVPVQLRSPARSGTPALRPEVSQPDTEPEGTRSAAATVAEPLADLDALLGLRVPAETGLPRE